MIRIVFFLILIGLAAAGAAWIAEQPGDVVMTWGPWKLQTGLPFAVLCLFVLVAAVLLLWSTLRGLWRTPGKIRRFSRERREARGRAAITRGLLAVGQGDTSSARQSANAARRLVGHDPLTLLLQAQTSQLEGDRDGAQRTFRTMAERPDTRLLGLRGLFIEAQRADDAVTAVMIAEEALKTAPSASWASHAVLGFRCARGEWNAALAILENNYNAGQLDKQAYRRLRGVLLTARALENETKDRDLARESAMEAVKLAPTLVPAAVLAAKFDSEGHQVRRAMKVLEIAWAAQPHPDIAEAYAHVRLGDSARQRLARIETLAGKAPGHVESALALARAAIDALEFARARTALATFIDSPTRRVAMLMAELESAEHNDIGKAREWALRAVRARHDPAWTADGYVSDHWRPVSPVTGRLDAFQWQTPVASLDSTDAILPSAFERAMLEKPERPTLADDSGETRAITAQPAVVTEEVAKEAPVGKSLDKPVDKPVEKPVEKVVEITAAPQPAKAAAEPKVQEKAQEKAPEPVKAAAPAEVSPPLQASAPAEPSKSASNSASAAVAVTAAAATAAVAAAKPAEGKPAEAGGTDAALPLFFRPGGELDKRAPVAPIVPIVRAPDDPGIEEEEEQPRDEFAEHLNASTDAGAWRNLLSRLSN